MKRLGGIDPIINAIPEVGFEPDSVLQLIRYYSYKTNRPLSDHEFSGSIYSNSLRADDSKDTVPEKPNLQACDRHLTNSRDMALLSADLKHLYSQTFPDAYLWNSLHMNEYPIADYMRLSVVRMVASMFGGGSDVNGFCTSGGTESIMTACRLYRNWGYHSRGIARGQTVIIGPTSIHAAFHKSGIAYDMTIALCKTDLAGRLDMGDMKRLLRRYAGRVVAIVGSAPSYPTGVVDDIPALAALALSNNTGLHVDCCLGGFIVNMLDQHDTNYLAIKGVTSLSADTHKNGWAPKGSSVLLLKPMHDAVYGPINAAYWSMYSIPEWSGGVYATLRDPGSQQCTTLLHAFVALLSVGKRGYKEIAQLVYQSCVDMAASIKEIPQLELLCEPEVNVVAFRANPAIWPPTAVYALVHQLNTHGFVLSAMKDNLVHFCATGRFAGDPELMGRWRTALTASVAAVDEMVIQVKEGKAAFPGDAGIYGALGDAMEPKVETQGMSKYVENWLFGNRGARDAVKGFWLGIIQPDTVPGTD
jgi:glutamate/tyrosine decarboxylase-like PLP-dependent enzyme